MMFSAESQCLGKIAFRTKKLAKRAARQAETAFGGGRMSPYRCAHCGWHHFGHAPHKQADRLKGPSVAVSDSSAP